MAISRKRRLTRAEFERLFPGDWSSRAGGRARQNGQFWTMVKPGQKVLFLNGSAGESGGVVTGKTWQEVAGKLMATPHEHDEVSPESAVKDGGKRQETATDGDRQAEK